MENMDHRIDKVKQTVMLRLIEDGYKMTNDQWQLLSNMPFVLVKLNEGNSESIQERFLYSFLKNHIDRFGLPNTEDLKLMQEIKQLIFEFNETKK